jgi:DNA polymerase III delta prime subunit
MNTKQDKLEFLKNLKKETDIHLILEELLPEMGFHDVKVTHEKGNKPEFGKDVVCSFIDTIENKKDWIAFVIKKGKVSGQSGVVKEIEDQVFECFKYPYKSLEQTAKIPINKVKVVTNETFSNGAKDKIFDSNNNDRANIDFWDSEKLVNFIDNHYPKFWIKGSKQYKSYIERFQKRIVSDNLAKTLGIDDNKVGKLLSCMIEPEIIERISNDKGEMQWKKRKINTIINLPDNSFIIGEAGSGKTTFFKNLAKEIIEQNAFRHDIEFYPILLSFIALRDNGYKVDSTISNYFKLEWNKDLNILWEEIKSKTNCCIFFDGLDELALIGDKERAVQALNDFHQSNPDIKLICSSRPSDYIFYNCENIGFKYLEINNLNLGQIESFINNYFNDEDFKSKKLLKSLKDTGLLNKLPKTPLTVALITILFDESEVEIPATITDLYTSFVDLLLGKYKPESTIDILEIGAKHRLLCFIAKELHTTNQKSIDDQSLITLIREYAAERGHKIDYERVIGDIINNTGLLIKNSRNQIQFKHLSFQEYFTAYEIFHHRQNDRNIIICNFNNLWWQNVALFYAGLSKDAPQLIIEILKENEPHNFNEYILNTGGIGKLLQALYNTPISERKLGLQRSTNNVVRLIEIVESSEINPQIKFWRNFSKYGLMQIFGGFFSHTHWSVTLVEVMKQVFNEKIEQLDGNERNFELEFELYLLAAILGSDDFNSYSELKLFIEKQNWLDINILAMLDTHLKRLKNIEKLRFRNDDDLKYLSKKVEQKKKRLGNIADTVNKPIKKLLEEKPAGNNAYDK